MSTETLHEYRKLRRAHPDYPARNALAAARDEIALQAAEDAGRIRFQVEPDWESVDPDDWGWSEHEARKYRRDMEAGRIAVWVVFAEVPRTCEHCGHALDDEWDVVASVGGVDVYENADGEAHVRSIQHDLAHEAGVI